MSKRISVFGSSMVERGSADYEDAVVVGAALARSGYTVMTGGYNGIMEAVSKGANEAGGPVVGVTTQQIEALRGARVNDWVTEHVPFPKLAERLNHLVREADAYVVMPGGVGTLGELTLAWEYMRVDEIPVRPLVCYGELWARVLEAFIDDRYVPEAHQRMVTFADTPAAVVGKLQQGGV